MAKALEDVTVVDFAAMVQGPLAAMMLGDMGADVIKVEPPGGEWLRHWAMANAYHNGQNLTFVPDNRNKRSVELDIKDDDQKEALYDIIEDADVFVENFRPGVAERLGLGYDELSSRNPGLIYCSATGYGETGPFSDRPGQDLIIQGMSGIAGLIGRKDDPPTGASLPITDFYSAANLAFAAVSALHYRDRTGEGQKITGDLLSAALHLQSHELAVYLNTGEEPERSEEGIANPYYHAPFGIYETADGYMTVSLSHPSIVGEALDIPRLTDVETWEEAYEDRDELKRALEETLRTESTDHWLSVMREHDIWAGPVLDYPELVEHPQVEAGGMIRSVDHPETGELDLLGIPYEMSETPGDIERPPPMAGEHTAEVLEEYGYGEEFVESVLERNGGD